MMDVFLTGTSPDGEDMKLHTYSVLGSYVIQVTATTLMESVMETYTITCQHPVTDFELLTPPSYLDFAVTGIL